MPSPFLNSMKTYCVIHKGSFVKCSKGPYSRDGHEMDDKNKKTKTKKPTTHELGQFVVCFMEVQGTVSS